MKRFNIIGMMFIRTQDKLKFLMSRIRNITNAAVLGKKVNIERKTSGF
jgi:hypothetical protein